MCRGAHPVGSTSVQLLAQVGSGPAAVVGISTISQRLRGIHPVTWWRWCLGRRWMSAPVETALTLCRLLGSCSLSTLPRHKSGSVSRPFSGVQVIESGHRGPLLTWIEIWLVRYQRVIDTHSLGSFSSTPGLTCLQRATAWL